MSMDKDEVKTRALRVLALLTAIGFVLLIAMQVVSADLGTYKQGECVSIKTILNTTAVNISTLSYPNSTIALQNVEMTKAGYTFNYSFCSTNLFGVYNYDYFDADGNVYVNSFSINGQGQEYSTTQGLVYGILFILLMLTCIGLLYGAFAIDGENIRNEEQEIVMVNYKKYAKYFLFAMAYVCFVGLTFFAWNIASGILNFESLGNFFFVFHRIAFVGMFLVVPILFYITVRKWVKEDNPILVQLRRGLTVT